MIFHVHVFLLLLLLLPLALQPTVGFGLSNNTSPFFPICHQLSLHLLTPSTWRSLSTSSLHPFLGLPLRLVPSRSWVKIFFGHPILLHSLQVTQPTYPLPLYPFSCVQNNMGKLNKSLVKTTNHSALRHQMFVRLIISWKRKANFLLSVEVTPSVFYKYMEEKYLDEYYCFGYEFDSSGRG